jgi:hypothetical protein
MLKYFMQLAVGITSGDFQKKKKQENKKSRSKKDFVAVFHPRKIYVLNKVFIPVGCKLIELQYNI